MYGLASQTVTCFVNGEENFFALDEYPDLLGIGVSGGVSKRFAKCFHVRNCETGLKVEFSEDLCRIVLGQHYSKRSYVEDALMHLHQFSGTRLPQLAQGAAG